MGKAAREDSWGQRVGLEREGAQTGRPKWALKEAGRPNSNRFWSPQQASILEVGYMDSNGLDC